MTMITKVSENHSKYSFNYSCPTVAVVNFQFISRPLIKNYGKYMVTILFDHSKVPKKRLLIKSLKVCMKKWQ